MVYNLKTYRCYNEKGKKNTFNYLISYSCIYFVDKVAFDRKRDSGKKIELSNRCILSEFV